MKGKFPSRGMRCCGENGFSLVEVAMSLGIATFAIIALTGLSSMALNQVRDSKQDIFWVNTTQEIAAELRMLPWQDVANLALPMSYHFDAEGQRLSSDEGAHYECVVSAAPGQLPNVPVGSYGSFLPLVIKLRWPTQANTPNEVTLPILISQFEPVALTP